MTMVWLNPFPYFNTKTVAVQTSPNLACCS